MDKLPASIFNDVIGPVMRGASSSHVAGAARIGLLVRQSLRGRVGSLVVDLDVNGSLAESYHGHGSDMGLASGILGFDLTDPRVPSACAIAADAGVSIEYRILDYGAKHPGNYRIRAASPDGELVEWEAISVGGGMIEMQKFNGFDVSICGDFYELLVTVEGTGADAAGAIAKLKALFPDFEACSQSEGRGRTLVELKLGSEPDEIAMAALRRVAGVLGAVPLSPILPTRSKARCETPFTTAEGLLSWMRANGKKELWELAVLYESARGEAGSGGPLATMTSLVGIMRESVRTGLAGADYADRILGPQAHKIDEGMRERRLIPIDMLATVVKYVTAIMEAKSSMGVIVAAPTAGSCGCLPGAVLGAADAAGFSEEAAAKAMMAAGLIGVFIAEGATFSAEVAGCQVECGAGSAMAAAGLAQLFGGDAERCLDAASMALQNVTGLACDPVANRVEVPCLGKNVMGASNALSSAMMALAGYDKVIPLDETIAAVYDIGRKLPLELRCTFGGLGKTRTSLDILKKLS